MYQSTSTIKSIGCTPSIRAFSTTTSVRARLPVKKNFYGDARKFFGPKDIRGEHYMNKYYYPSSNNRPRYLVPDGSSLVGANAPSGERTPGASSRGRDSGLHPFPNNLQTTTAHMIPDQFKAKIVREIKEKGLSAQEISIKYKINLLRVEAIVKLEEVKQNFTPEVCIISLMLE